MGKISHMLTVQNAVLALYEEAGFSFVNVNNWGEYAFKTVAPESKYDGSFARIFDRVNHSPQFPLHPSSNGEALVGILSDQEGDTYSSYYQMRLIDRIFTYGSVDLLDNGHFAAFVWVQQGKPLVKHIVRTRNLNEVYLCVNGFPVFLLKFADPFNTGFSFEAHPAPAYTVTTDGKDFEVEEFSVSRKAYTGVNVYKFLAALLREENLQKFCLGEPVNCDGFWLTLDIFVALAYSGNNEAVSWLVKNCMESPVDAICFNKLVDESVLKQAVLKTVSEGYGDVESPTGSIFLGRECLSSDFLAWMLDSDFFKKEEIFYKLVLLQKHCPLGWFNPSVLKKLIGASMISRKDVEEAYKANHSWVVSEVKRMYGDELSGDYPSGFLAKYLADAMLRG